MYGFFYSLYIMKQFTDILSEDQSLITYRKSLNDITGHPMASIVLSQMLYWWNKKDKKPFYKFSAPCEHKAYKDGDSWQEELGFSRKQFDTALERICFKKIKSKQRPNKYGLTEDTALIVCWQTIDRMTYYKVNIDLINEKIANAQKGQQEKPETGNSESTNGALDITETTTKTTTGESKDTHPNPLVEQERAKAREYKKELEGRISFTESDNPEKDLKQLIELEYIKSLEKLGRWRELASDDKKQFLSDFCLKKAFTPFNDRNHLLNTLTVWLANYKSYKSYKPTVQAEEPRKKLNYV